MARIDFEIFGGRTFYPLHPRTRAMCACIGGHLAADATRLGEALALEWLYIGDVVGKIADGLRVR